MKELEYKELLDRIFVRFPSVQNSGFGKEAYKPGLEHMVEFLDVLGNPHRAYRTVHVAGTNGKGSVCNMLASSLSATGLKTGLYTSPHILDFRERMRILEEGDTPAPSSLDTAGGRGGLGECLPQYGQSRQPLGCHFDRSGEIYKLVPKEYVFDFLKRWGSEFERLNLSFFEITTGMAFKWFADEGVDVAVIEVGLGGRLDSTNVIVPELSIITSIGLDHCDLLGDSLEAIAGEKAGIIKAGVPVVIGEYRPETAPVFIAKADACKSQIYFANSPDRICHPQTRNDGRWVKLDLQGEYQEANLRTVLTALAVLGIEPDLEAIAHTAVRAGFGGRWEHLSERPLVICDIGHNAHALKHNFGQLESMMASGEYDCLIIVYAVMADKDLDAILPLMPQQAHYIFTTPKGKRAMPAAKILERYMSGQDQVCYPEAIDDVQEAVREALKEASAYKKPIIYIGGSTFAVAEAKPLFQ